MKILRERGLRDLKRQPGRYIALLLLILLGVTVSTGISAGNESALAAVLDSQERGHVEDGYLTVPEPLDEELVSTLTEYIGTAPASISSAWIPELPRRTRMTSSWKSSTRRRMESRSATPSTGPD